MQNLMLGSLALPETTDKKVFKGDKLFHDLFVKGCLRVCDEVEGINGKQAEDPNEANSKVNTEGKTRQHT